MVGDLETGFEEINGDLPEADFWPEPVPLSPPSDEIKGGAVALFVFERPSGASISLRLTRLGPESLAVVGYPNSWNFSARCPYFLVITRSAWTNS